MYARRVYRNITLYTDILYTHAHTRSRVYIYIYYSHKGSGGKEGVGGARIRVCLRMTLREAYG